MTKCVWLIFTPSGFHLCISSLRTSSLLKRISKCPIKSFPLLTLPAVPLNRYTRKRVFAGICLYGRCSTRTTFLMLVTENVFKSTQEWFSKVMWQSFPSRKDQSKSPVDNGDTGKGTKLLLEEDCWEKDFQSADVTLLMTSLSIKSEAPTVTILSVTIHLSFINFSKNCCTEPMLFRSSIALSLSDALQPKTFTMNALGWMCAICFDTRNRVFLISSVS